MIVGGEVVMEVPSNLITMDENAAKFCPVTFMTKLLEFLFPEIGWMAIEGFTVKAV